MSDNSPAIDYCGAISFGSQPKDLDEDLRGFDDPAVPNDRGITFDAGYDENYRFSADLIFEDGVEGMN